MAQYSKIVSGRFTSTGVAKFIALPMMPKRVDILNKTQYNSTTANTGKEAHGFEDDADGTAYVLAVNAGNTTSNVTITSGGFTWVDAGTYLYGPATTATAGTPVSQANPAVVTSASHGLQTGDVVWIYGTTGMLQIAGIPYQVTRINANSFSIPVDSSGFAAAATSVSWKKYLYPDLYIPELCYITNITRAASAVVTFSFDHDFVVGQQVQFNLPDGWGMVEMNDLKGYVTAVSAGSITVNIDSSGFTAFAFPTSANAALGITYPHCVSIGDANTGYSGPTVPLPQTIPGAFVANTRQGVLIGVGNGTTVLHTTSDVVEYRFELPDMYQV